MSTPEHARWFAEEVQPHEPMLRAYLQKEFPALADLDDIVQESHLRLIKARERGGIASAKAYLFAIARNVALGVFRRNRHFPSVPVNELGNLRLLEGDADAAETASCNQEIALATAAIDTLPPRCREIVMLRALRGMAHREIAARLGLSEQTVRVQVARGMKKCARYLREHGVERPRPS